MDHHNSEIYYRLQSYPIPTSGTRRVNLVTNPVISRERGNDHEVLTTSGRYSW
jgi:hypothetical protein